MRKQGKYVMIAPIGKRSGLIFPGIRDFPTEKLVLLSTAKNRKSTEKIRKELSKFHIQVQVLELAGNMWEAIFEKIAYIKNAEHGKELLINTSSSDRNSQCALTSAAFVNGIKAFAIEGNESMLLPILKFSYYKTLTERKLSLLHLLYRDETCCASLEELGKKAKMSLPLVSYHVHGTRDAEGLENLGLIEIEKEKGKTKIKVSSLGKMLMKGYVQ